MKRGKFLGPWLLDPEARIIDRASRSLNGKKGLVENSFATFFDDGRSADIIA